MRIICVNRSLPPNDSIGGLSAVKRMKTLSVFLIKIYQFFARPFQKRCRFYPSCSVYAVESLKKFGFFKGWFLTIKRLFKCGPWHPGGFDPVP